MMSGKGINMVAHVFVSYAHEDIDFVNDLSRKIAEAGFQSWIDSVQLRAGVDWRAKIGRAIRGSLALIVIVTPDSVPGSEYVRYEWAFALGAGKPVIPVMRKATDLPAPWDVQYLNFTHYKARPWEELNSQLRELKAASLSSVKSDETRQPLEEIQTEEEDELYKEAVDLVTRSNKASNSLLQRRLRIGYTRAARLIDLMVVRGVILPTSDTVDLQ
jgi:TIR domain-containing protein/DNA translocase FtsK/SpoIIIE-like protein